MALEGHEKGLHPPKSKDKFCRQSSRHSKVRTDRTKPRPLCDRQIQKSLYFWVLDLGVSQRLKAKKVFDVQKLIADEIVQERQSPSRLVEK